MSVTKYDGGNRMCLNITQGKLRQASTEGTPGAVKREWTAPDGSSGVKWEMVYESMTGRVTNMYLKDTDFGIFLVVAFDGGESLSLHTDHRYFTDFVKKAAGADFTMPMTIKPYDFEDNNKKRITGMTIMQDGEKLEDYFYDFKTKVQKHDFPKPEGETKSYSKDDWKIYFLTVKKFLISYVTLSIIPSIVDEDIPVGDILQEESELKIEDVPF